MKRHSDTPAVALALSFWAIIILSMIFGVLKAGEFVWVKTSNAIVSYKEGAPAREVARKKRAKAYKVTSAEKAIALAKDKEELHAKKQSAKIAGLKASNPNGDAYSASQSYWILIVALVAVFCVWAGVWTRTPIGMAIACIFVIVGSLIIWFW